MKSRAFIFALFLFMWTPLAHADSGAGQPMPDGQCTTQNNCTLVNESPAPAEQQTPPNATQSADPQAQTQDLQNQPTDAAAPSATDSGNAPPSQPNTANPEPGSDPQNLCGTTVAEVNDERDQDIKDCNDAISNASDCCSAGSCGDSSLPGKGGGNSKLINMMMTMEASTLMAQSSPGQLNDMSALCNGFGGVTGAGAQQNLSIVASCNRFKNKCQDKCQPLETKWEDRAAYLTNNCNKTSNSVRAAMNVAGARIKNLVDKCGGLSADKSIKAQAINFGGANQVAMQNVCRQLAAQQVMQPQQMMPVTTPQTVDCTNPILAQTYASQCSACAQGNGGQPCAQAVVDGGTASNFQPASGVTANGAGLNVNAAGDLRAQQNPQLGNSANNPNANQNQAGMMDPGMMGMGGAPSPGGGGGIAPSVYDPGIQPRAGVGPAYHTDILNGERSGGYSSPGPSLIVDTSNGFKGYGNSQDSAGIDLKRYLPGADHYAGRRQVAGVGTANPDINTFTTDLFKRISDRFKVICSMNRLVDCNPPKQPN